MSSTAARNACSWTPSREQRTDPTLWNALASGGMYEGSPHVVVRETHASWVFLAGERAYKIKKPVAFGFLNYSTLSARRAACREELRINRELAPEIYLDVLAIVRHLDGLCFAAEDVPDAIEYVVKMRRFEEAQTVAGLIDAGTLAPTQIRAAARRLACFHRSAPVVQGGGADQPLASWQKNLAELQALNHDSAWRLDLLASFGDSFVRRHRRELDGRVAAGHIRDGHGDLRCEHVLIGPTVAIVDRIEFDPALREIDVCADLAFLTMDLQARGESWAARELVSAYRREGGHPGREALRSFYGAQRALVRAKVSLLDAAEHARDVRAVHYAHAEALFVLAERLCWRARRPLAIMVCGAPASGKSTLAEELSRRSELPVASSDVVRKQLAGLRATARARPEHYSEQFTRATYEALAEQARQCLLGEGGVILDATCHSPEQRRVLLNRLTPGARCLTVHCQANERLTVRRAVQRMASEQRTSDATPQIAARQWRDFQPPSELPSACVLSLDTETALKEQVSRVIGALDGLLAYPD